MGEALLSGLLRAGHLAPEAVAVCEPRAGRQQELADRYGVTVQAEVAAADAAILAVKPPDITAVAAQVAGRGATRLLSIAAGVSTAAIEAAVGPGVAVVRAMPNTPALVGAGMAAIAAGSAAGDADLAWAGALLSSVGEVVRVNEADLDAVTAISGSGPAYVFRVAEVLAAAGTTLGLDPEVATRLAVATVAGAGKMLAESGRSATELREQVTSPGGTTAAALAVLDDGGLDRLFERAARAAADRSVELGQ